ncbi:hypothetical protein G9A89_008749 [Geosiphon pyriformis]|nr:hypothetical protein G9A89_008749 [Geosiphon pyriformis]
MLLSYCLALADSSCDFDYVNKCLLNSGLGSVTIYTDSSVKNLGLLGVCGGAAVYFSDVNTGVEVKIDGLLSSTLVKLQAIVLVLECVLAYWSINLFTDSQALLDLCNSDSGVSGLDFCDKCWIKKEYICHVESRPVFGNAYHVAKKLFNAVHSVGWKAKYIGSFVSANLYDCFDKTRTFCVWHPDGKIKFDYTSTVLATLWLYFIKVLHYCLSVAKRKKMYNLNYPSIAYIWCGLVENSDHVFSCTHDANVQKILLSNTTLE